MNKQLKRLIELQSADDRISALQHRLDAIPVRIYEARSDLLKVQEGLEKLNAEVDGQGKERRANERNLESIENKIKKLREQELMVSSNKEYQVLLHEIENMERQKSDFEDKILTMMEESSAMEEKIKEQEKAAFDVRKMFEEEEKKLKSEEAELKSKMEAARRVREEIIASVEGEHIHNYDRLIEFWKGQAVVSVKEGVCQGCHMSLPPQKFQEVKTNENILLCNQCKRILYFKEDSTGGKS